MSKSEQLTELPEWYGKHDNPHHAGLRSHQRRIAQMENELFEYTGVKGKHFSLQRGKLRPSELTEGFEPPT